ncbi:MAG: VOC family protein, partial [Maribacter sp.]
MVEIINGIQQIGIGVEDTKTVFNWYRKHLGFDILLFKDEAVATLMTQYTNGIEERRDAYLSLNMVGGGGLEIWQFKDRTPASPKAPVQLGDLGIYAMKVRCRSLKKLHDYLIKEQAGKVGALVRNDTANAHFYFEDPFGNQVQMVEDSYAFCETSAANGGVMGAVIGVSDMEKSISFYRDLLGYDIVLHDVEEQMEKNTLKGSPNRYRKVILAQKRQVIGGFGDLLGPTQLELIQVMHGSPSKIFQGRLWGDLGYIHLCFDVQGMTHIREKAKNRGNAFTVDSANSFDMGDAAGHFSYIEDPDGTLIELVETHKVPIFKALG